MNEILTREHRRFKKFCERLEGKEGCNFQEDEKGKITWDCAGSHNQDLAKEILKSMRGIDVEGTLSYFTANGGHCDCEILFNVE